jgi:hypothetical protein
MDCFGGELSYFFPSNKGDFQLLTQWGYLDRGDQANHVCGLGSIWSGVDQKLLWVNKWWRMYGYGVGFGTIFWRVHLTTVVWTRLICVEKDGGDCCHHFTTLGLISFWVGGESWWIFCLGLARCHWVQGQQLFYCSLISYYLKQSFLLEFIVLT